MVTALDYKMALLQTATMELLTSCSLLKALGNAVVQQGYVIMIWLMMMMMMMIRNRK